MALQREVRARSDLGCDGVTKAVETASAEKSAKWETLRAEWTDLAIEGEGEGATACEKYGGAAI